MRDPWRSVQSVSSVFRFGMRLTAPTVIVIFPVPSAVLARTNVQPEVGDAI
jgi:hypothetical protein